MDSGKDNKAAVRACLEIVSRQDLDALDRILSTGYVLHDRAFAEEIRGTEGLRELLPAYRTAIGGVRLTTDHQFTDGDCAATRWSVRGRHQGERWERRRADGRSCSAASRSVAAATARSSRSGRAATRSACYSRSEPSQRPS